MPGLRRERRAVLKTTGGARARRHQATHYLLEHRSISPCSPACSWQLPAPVGAAQVCDEARQHPDAHLQRRILLSIPGELLAIHWRQRFTRQSRKDAAQLRAAPGSAHDGTCNVLLCARAYALVPYLYMDGGDWHTSLPQTSSWRF